MFTRVLQTHRGAAAALCRGFASSPYHPLAGSVEVGQLLSRKSHGHGVAHKITTVGGDASVLEAITAMADGNLGSVLITEDDQVAGIFTERDYLKKVEVAGKTEENTKCSEVMTPSPFCVTPHNTLDDCLRWMVENHARHLPVVVYKSADSSNFSTRDLVGMLSVRDVVNMLHRLGASAQWQKLSNLTVQEALSYAHTSKETVYTIKEQATVKDAITRMAEFNVGSLIVNDKNQMSGIFTERDYLTKLKLKGLDINTTTVGQVMTSTPTCIAPNYTLDQAMEIFKNKNFRHLPVVDNDGLDSQSDCTGLLSVTDILTVTGQQVTH